jgi:hypothetical protein
MELPTLDYRRSYAAATAHVERRTRTHGSAFAQAAMLPVTEQRIREFLWALVPLGAPKDIFLNTACRLTPHGFVTAECVKFESDPAAWFVTMDTGVGDFFGNVFCLLMALHSQKAGKRDYGFDDTSIGSAFWMLGLLYYDFGFDRNREALLLPHFQFSHLDAEEGKAAYSLSLVALQFFVLHEFGHIVDDVGTENLTGRDAEFSADLFAFTGIMKDAFPRGGGVIELANLGILVLLLAMAFVEETFPGLSYVRGGHELTFPTLSGMTDHPAARDRFNRLWGDLPTPVRRRLEDHPLLRLAEKTFDDCRQRIRGGSRPSEHWWQLQEKKLVALREGRTVSGRP